jgi:hypothetical protein
MSKRYKLHRGHFCGGVYAFSEFHPVGKLDVFDNLPSLKNPFYPPEEAVYTYLYDSMYDSIYDSADD